MTEWMEIIRDSPLPEIYNDESTYPPIGQRFRAFELTPFNKVKCVILGQDPYHTDGDANGLAFSVNFNRRIPPSLRNILNEYVHDLGFNPPRSGDLSNWARNGVLLLNTALTVIPHNPGSLINNWKPFTSYVLQRLNYERKNLVFILWGRHAQDYAPSISVRRVDGHFIIRSPHPSPYSARSGFFGSKPFSKTNTWLESKGIEPVDWRLP